MVKVYLSRKGIPFTERNVSLDPQAMDDLLKLGYRATPVTLVKNQRLVGYNPKKLEAALVAAGFQEAPPPG
ncbi:MAG: glutaredoxin family protein [Chloroflexi bacterium]|nr:glutaredoxin family protein [Chloroflexota bacterium]